MSNDSRSCKVDALVTIDSKGQIVIPKDLRDKADLKPEISWLSSDANPTVKYAV